MSARERDRLKVIGQVVAGEVGRVDAARLLGVSVRQLRRIVARYVTEGDCGLVHRLRGRPSNRQVEGAVRAEAVALIREHYGDYGPKLASEVLWEEHEIAASRETVRQWMTQEGLWKPRKQAVVHRQWRERRRCVGEMVQMDTSIHDWFEGRGESAVLIALIDDASSRIFLRFYQADSTATNMDLLRRYISRHGRPVALYKDKASHFKTTRCASAEEQLEGREAETQIQRALRELEIEDIAAHSPQAKGRVERLFKTLQDRLVKALRRKNISTIEDANHYLECQFMGQWRKQFSVTPACALDAHRSRKGYDLGAILSVQHTRSVANDYTIQYRNERYQIAKSCARRGMRQDRVIIENRLDGKQRLRWRGNYIRFKKISPQETPVAGPATPVALRPPSVTTPAKTKTPEHNHPWKRPYKSGHF